MTRSAANSGSRIETIEEKDGRLGELTGHVEVTTENMSEMMPLMEAVLKRVHDSPAYKEYAERNMFEDAWLGSAEFAKQLVQQRISHIEFLKHLGVVK